MKRAMIVMAVLLMATMASAQVTTLVGENYVEADVEVFDILEITGAS